MYDFPISPDGIGISGEVFPKELKYFRITGYGALKWLISKDAGDVGFKWIFSEFVGWCRKLRSGFSERAEIFPNSFFNQTEVLLFKFIGSLSAAADRTLVLNNFIEQMN